MIPDLDHPFCSAGEEDGRDVRVPGDVVDGGVMSLVRLEVLGAVLCRALVDESLVGAHQDHGLVRGVEGDAATSL